MNDVAFHNLQVSTDEFRKNASCPDVDACQCPGAILYRAAKQCLEAPRAQSEAVSEMAAALEALLLTLHAADVAVALVTGEHLSHVAHAKRRGRLALANVRREKNL